MCGIFCAVSQENVIDDCLNGLKKLEYRGYDSAGIGFFENDTLGVVKSLGYVSKLEEKVLQKHIVKQCAISHTRWATHGQASENNSHPILSENKLVAVVHNGIIENYLNIKNTVLKNVNFKTQTDTEIISNLLEHYIKKGLSNIESLQKLTKLIVGNYAIAVIFKTEKNVIYFAKNNSSLVIGKSKNKMYISSDSSCLTDFANEIYYVKDNEIGFVSCEFEFVYDCNNLQKKEIKYEKNSKISQKYDSLCAFHMLKEIYEEKVVIAETIKQNKFKCLVDCFGNVQNIENVYIIACGTAYHASLIGASLLLNLGYNVITQVASEFKYSKAKLMKNSVAIFISQSGETIDTISCVKKCNESNIKTIAITNVQNSLITKCASSCLYTFAGPEVAVASTKAYVCQVALMMQISEFFKNYNEEKYNSFCNKLAGQCELINNLSENYECESMAKKYKNFNDFYLIGRLNDYYVAQESALKIKEITYKHCEAYPAGELKHGTIAQITENSVVIAFVTQSDIFEKMISNINEVKSRGAKIIVVTSESLAEKFDKKLVDDFLLINHTTEEFYIFQAIEKMQLFSYYLAILLGNNPDKPRNLAKSVTVE